MMENTSAPERHDGETKYKGVRKRKWGKWVSEIRLPNSRERIWLGSYDSPEKAARAFDAALFCLRGRHAKFNFPDNPPDIPGACHLSPAEIQAAASSFAANASSTSDPPRSHYDSEMTIDNSHSPSGGDTSLDVVDRSIWDTVGSTYNTNINYLHCNYNHSYDNSNMFSGWGSGYPTEYGIFQGFDDLSTDFYVPTAPDTNAEENYDTNAEENYDTGLNHGSFLWNF